MNLMENKAAGLPGSKPLCMVDDDGNDLSRRALKGDPTHSTNFDRLQYDFVLVRWVMFEYIKVEEAQSFNGFHPHVSDPNGYWKQCKGKYLLLWDLRRLLSADFYIVFYAHPGTFFSNEYRVMHVLSVTDSGLDYEFQNHNFESFSDWFREQNRNAKGKM